MVNSLSRVPQDAYVCVGAHGDNEVAEVRNESCIESVAIKPVGFNSSDSNEQYVKLYTQQYTESGCMRFVR